jgi:DNA-binding NtrC family response regulator
VYIKLLNFRRDNSEFTLSFPVVTDDIPAALQAVSELKPALVVDGGSTEDFAFVRQIRAYDVNLPVVLLAEQGSVENAVHAIQEEGVYHYFEKPIDPQ